MKRLSPDDLSKAPKIIIDAWFYISLRIHISTDVADIIEEAKKKYPRYFEDDNGNPVNDYLDSPTEKLPADHDVGEFRLFDDDIGSQGAIARSCDNCFIGELRPLRDGFLQCDCCKHIVDISK